MTKDFYTEHNKQINSTVEKNQVKYTKQVARTQLQSEWTNPVFVIHKQR